MPYTYTCDGCDAREESAPPFMGEFRETWLKTADSPLTEAYNPGQTVTLCRRCLEGLL